MDGVLTDEDESMMVALSVATAVGLLCMVLGLVFWKRNRRRNLYHYRADGYGKVRLFVLRSSFSCRFIYISAI